MTARESAPKAGASTPTDAPAEGPAPEPAAPESTPEQASTPESVVEPEHAPRHAAPEPVQRYKAPRPAPFRAGGHVLTERGWELDTGQFDSEQEN